MARKLYTLLWWIALPFLPLRLWWRGRRESGYRARIGERFGWYRRGSPRGAGDLAWIHAVSLGEPRAAAPRIERSARERPTTKIVLSQLTARRQDARHEHDGDRRNHTTGPD